MFVGNLGNPLPPFWRAYNAADRREFSGGEIPSGHAVSRDHKIFDNLLSTVLFLYFKRTDLVAIEYRFGLDGFQAKRPVDVTEILHPSGYLVLQAESLLQ